MTRIGYALSSEEHPPSDLVSFAGRAERAGFDFLRISDHFHPWIDRQGQSPFVWGVLGWDCAGDRADPHHRRHLPDDQDASRDRGAGGCDGRRDDARPVLARARHGREPERARSRRPVAGRRRASREWWPNSALPGELSVELPLPRQFEQAAELVSEEAVCKELTCGPDPERHLGALRAYIDAGYDHVYVHQIGPDQEGFFLFYERDVLPRIRR